jgi:hypothetical protein
MEQIPTSRRELERNLFLLGEKLKDGKIKFHPRVIHTIDGLMRLRKLPNGRVDLLSLDEMTRLNANMLADMEQQIPPTGGEVADTCSEGPENE